MTDAEKTEREEVFLWCALRNEKERELWRKYGTLRADELPDDSGEPFLKRKMFEIFTQLAEAGFGEEGLPMPFEHPKCEADARKMMSVVWSDNNSFPKVSFNFAVLQGGRVAGYDPAPWWKAVEKLYDDDRLGGWRLNDEKVIVKLYSGCGEDWYEIHERTEMPSVIESFKDVMKTVLQDTREGVEFPICRSVVFEVNCIGGVKIYFPTGEAGDTVGWAYLEAFPLVDSVKGSITREGWRSYSRH